MNRVEALRVLVAWCAEPDLITDERGAALTASRLSRQVFASALDGCRNAVAHLEEPLRVRGWEGPSVQPGHPDDDGGWWASWDRRGLLPNGPLTFGAGLRAPTEGSAGRRGGGRCLIWEAEQGDPS